MLAVSILLLLINRGFDITDLSTTTSETQLVPSMAE